MESAAYGDESPTVADHAPGQAFPQVTRVNYPFWIAVIVAKPVRG
jgi:hypothetical protein